MKILLVDNVHLKMTKSQLQILRSESILLFYFENTFIFFLKMQGLISLKNDMSRIIILKKK